MSSVSCEYGCTYNGIEVKANANPQITNPLYCCREYRNTTVTSELNPTPVVAYTRSSKYFEIEYRFVNAVKPTKGTTPSEAKTTTTSASERTTERTKRPEGKTTKKPIEKPTTAAPVVPPKDCVNPLTFSMVVLKRFVNDELQKHSYISDNFLVNSVVSQGFRQYGQIGKVVDPNAYEDNKAVLEPLCPSLVKLRSFVDTSVLLQFMTVDDNEAQAKIDAGWHEAPACGANRNLRSVTAYDGGDIICSTYNKELKDLNSSHHYGGTLSPTICWLF